MAEPDSGIAAGTQAPVFQLQRVYLKDASLELPHAPGIFLVPEAPQVDVQLEVTHEKVVDGIYEVTVRVTATARVKVKTQGKVQDKVQEHAEDQVLFLVEAKQAGIFEMRGIPNEQFDPIVGVVCPGIVYPYLRANIADLISRTGLPPIHLAEINFEAMYQQRLAQQAPGLIVPPGSSTKQ
jgi:preprotein translocase subunit SecB